MTNHTQYNLALSHNPIEQKNEIALSNEPGRMTEGYTMSGFALLACFSTR